MVDSAGKDLRKAQERYRRNFNRDVRAPREAIGPDDLAFERKEYFGEKKHKLSPVADGPYRVAEVTPTTVTV